MSRWGLTVQHTGDYEYWEVLPGSEDNDPNYHQIRDGVGGYIEPLRVANDLLIYLNEDGKALHLPLNSLATRFVILRYQTKGVHFGDSILGPVVFVGDDGSPNSTGIPDRWIEVFTKMGMPAPKW